MHAHRLQETPARTPLLATSRHVPPIPAKSGDKPGGLEVPSSNLGAPIEGNPCKSGTVLESRLAGAVSTRCPNDERARFRKLRRRRAHRPPEPSRARAEASHQSKDQRLPLLNKHGQGSHRCRGRVRRVPGPGSPATGDRRSISIVRLPFGVDCRERIQRRPGGSIESGSRWPYVLSICSTDVPIIRASSKRPISAGARDRQRNGERRGRAFWPVTASVAQPKSGRVSAARGRSCLRFTTSTAKRVTCSSFPMASSARSAASTTREGDRAGGRLADGRRGVTS